MSDLYFQGKYTRQAHKGIPEGAFEEEQGHKGFFGPVSHLIKPQPSTRWTKIEGPLRPHMYDLVKMSEKDGWQRMLAWFERQLGPHDLLVDLPYWHFIEWAHVGRDGEAAIINAMHVGALRSAASLADSLGYERAGRRYAGLAERISAAINTRMWDETRGVYVDMVDPQTGVRNLKVSQHANAAMILWDIAPPPRWPRTKARRDTSTVPLMEPRGPPREEGGIELMRAG